MPKRTDLKKIMIIGAGPIVIGQACEFDYSGTQACKALKEEGYEVVLINSNPATIMTDPEFASKTYVEPITPEVIEEIIKKERPDAILPTVGGQTALNAAVHLAEKGILKKYNVELIGAKLEAIKKAEDRELFKEAMFKIGLEMPKSREVYGVEDAIKVAEELGYPLILRPAFTLGGTGGGVAYDQEQLELMVQKAIDASTIGQVLVEESIIGWKEIELEVMRDLKDNVVIICSIENLDPMGVHTGDSITVAPVQTLTDKEYQVLRDHSIAVMREIGVDTGGSNVQFAMDPKSKRVIIIEMNPRVSRSSALASKATGFPIAKIAAKLAVGYTLEEIPNDITKETPASFEPTIDYVVTKIPRFAFEKFPDTKDVLNTQMKSVGEAMAIGRTFKESLVKAMRSMEISKPKLDLQNIEEKLKIPNSVRLYYIFEAFRQKWQMEKIAELTQIDPWFLSQIEEIVSNENISTEVQGKQLSRVYKKVDTCGAEFEAKTPYYYSTYDLEDEITPAKNKKERIIILGGGPNRIGQGIEFDYCCVHASFALKVDGYETVMVNCNPETVSTDYDTSNLLYFEPLTYDDVLNIIKREKPKGVIVQLGGQTPLNLAVSLEKAGAKILGTTPAAIHRAEDRGEFGALLHKLEILQPANGAARSLGELKKIAKNIGYPVIVRPSYVLGGRAMEIVYDEKSLEKYAQLAIEASEEHPVLVDKFLEDAIEVDVDALADGEQCLIAGVMEHIERAGIHSGDSACVLPTVSLKPELVKQIKEQTYKLAAELGVVGLMNIQYAVQKNKLFVLEVNPRASRTIPFVSKATGVPWAKMAARVMAGKTIAELELKEIEPSYFSVKEVVLPFAKFSGQDTVLGPEMKSTGEVMGIDMDLGLALAKAEMAAGEKIPLSGTAFLSVVKRDKTEHCLDVARKLKGFGFKLLCTKGTAAFLRENNIEVKEVLKIREGHPNVVDAIKKREISLVINTPSGKGPHVDDFFMREAALRHKVFCITTMAAAQAAVKSIEALKTQALRVVSLQEHYRRNPGLITV
ncbi:carbamoyl-phosphate synthase large subunit [Candidatus Margulisiibacteriota bacterium]